ncbi:hypothetical protein [Desulfobacula sp.]|uniref:hypothetical protein n=1 Tax=Desulfobacula sp. TaxID=2593537 RepID=UPI0025C716C7|nr:hypothetical protein [Desulfobacula sp.]MBC2704799.1 hypothetical protein [Desulfobacula sp.]
MSTVKIVKNINVNNITRIHRSPAPWIEARAIFYGLPKTEKQHVVFLGIDKNNTLFYSYK